MSEEVDMDEVIILLRFYLYITIILLMPAYTKSDAYTFLSSRNAVFLTRTIAGGFNRWQENACKEGQRSSTHGTG